jgi:hypothetical protein
MGLGKTLSIVSLIATSRPQPAAPAPVEEDQPPPAKKRKQVGGAAMTTGLLRVMYPLLAWALYCSYPGWYSGI